MFAASSLSKQGWFVSLVLIIVCKSHLDALLIVYLCLLGYVGLPWRYSPYDSVVRKANHLRRSCKTLSSWEYIREPWSPDGTPLYFLPSNTNGVYLVVWFWSMDYMKSLCCAGFKHLFRLKLDFGFLPVPWLTNYQRYTEDLVRIIEREFCLLSSTRPWKLWLLSTTQASLLLRERLAKWL